MLAAIRDILNDRPKLTALVAATIAVIALWWFFLRDERVVENWTPTATRGPSAIYATGEIEAVLQAHGIGYEIDRRDGTKPGYWSLGGSCDALAVPNRVETDLSIWICHPDVDALWVACLCDLASQIRGPTSPGYFYDTSSLPAYTLRYGYNVYVQTFNLGSFVAYSVYDVFAPLGQRRDLDNAA